MGYDRFLDVPGLAQSSADRYEAVRQQALAQNCIATLQHLVKQMNDGGLQDQIGYLIDAVSELEHRISAIDEALATADMIERPRGSHYRSVA